MNYNPECKFDYKSLVAKMVTSNTSTTIQIEPKNTTLQIGDTNGGLLIDS